MFLDMDDLRMDLIRRVDSEVVDSCLHFFLKMSTVTDSRVSNSRHPRDHSYPERLINSQIILFQIVMGCVQEFFMNSYPQVFHNNM